MGASEVVMALLLSVGQAFAKEATLRTVKWFRDVEPVERAAAATEKQFPEFADLRTTLLTWLDSDEVRIAITATTQGQQSVDHDALLSGFVGTGFYDGDTTEDSAQQILAAFQRNLLEEALKGNGALAVLDSRNQMGFERILAEIRESRANPQPPVASVVASNAEELFEAKYAETSGEIMSAKELIDAGQLRSARMILAKHRDSPEWLALPYSLRFRIATNLGCCALGLGIVDEAKSCFAEALVLRPDDSRALANASVIAGVGGDWEEALAHATRALAIPEDQDFVAAAYVRALIGLDRWLDAEAYIDEYTRAPDDLAFCLTVGDGLASRREFVRASRWLERALAISPDDVHALVSSARCRLEMERLKLRETAPLAWQLLPVDRETLVAISERLSYAIVKLAEQDFRSLHSEALSDRSSTYLRLGRKEEALQDALKAVGLTPEVEDARLTLAVAYVANGDAPRALEQAGMLVGPLRSEGDRLRCWALWAERRFSEVIPLARAMMAERAEPEIADFYIEALEVLAPDDLPLVLEDVERRSVSDLGYLAVLASHYERTDQPALARKVLAVVATAPPSPDRDRAIAQLARVHIVLKEHAEAARLYGLISDPAVDSPWARYRVVELFNSGQFSEALASARMLRAKFGSLQHVADVEVAILKFVGNFRAAAEVLEGLVGQLPSPDAIRLRQVPLLLLAGDTERGTELLRLVREDALSLPGDLMQLAQLRRLLVAPGALSAAYSAVQSGFSDPKVLLSYCGFLTASRQHETWSETIPRSSVGTAVVLIKGNEQRVWILVNKGDPTRRDLGEVAVDGQLGKSLLGLTKGDVITIGSNDGDWVVSDVVSKFSGMVRIILAKYEQWFPESSDLKTVHVSDKHLSEFLKTLDERSKFVTGVMAQYKAKNMTLGTFAKLVGSDLREVWMSLAIAEGNPSINVATGLAADMTFERDALAGDPRLVVELSFLLAMAHLDLLEVLAQWPGGVAISPWLIEELAEEIWRLETEATPSGVAGSHNGRYFFHELSQELRERRLNGMRMLLSWCRTVASVTDHEDALQAGRARLDQMKAVLGFQAAGAILAAARPGHCLLSDDLLVRAASRASGVQEATWSQPFLRALTERGLLTRDVLCEATATLSSLNYLSVSISADDLVWAMGNGGAGGANLKSMLWSLRSEACSTESAVRVAAGFLATIWPAPQPAFSRDSVGQVTLQALSVGRRPRTFLDELHTRLAALLETAPLHRSNITAFLRAWESVQPIV